MPEGYVSHRLLIQCFDGPEEGIARAAATGPAREGILKGLEEYGRSGRLTELERQRDNYLISLFKGAKFAEGRHRAADRLSYRPGAGGKVP